MQVRAETCGRFTPFSRFLTVAALGSETVGKLRVLPGDQPVDIHSPISVTGERCEVAQAHVNLHGSRNAYFRLCETRLQR